MGIMQLNYGYFEVKFGIVQLILLSINIGICVLSSAKINFLLSYSNASNDLSKFLCSF